MQLSLLFCVVVAVLVSELVVEAGSKAKPHPHKGILEPFDGSHVPYSITPEQNKQLLEGKPVSTYVRDGASGKGVVIQDIAAPK